MATAMQASMSSTRAPLSPFPREWWLRCRAPSRQRQALELKPPQRGPPRAVEPRRQAPRVQQVGGIQRPRHPAQRRRRRARLKWSSWGLAGRLARQAVAPKRRPAAAQVGSERKARRQARPTMAPAAPQVPRSWRRPTTRRPQARSTMGPAVSGEEPAGLPAAIPNRWRLVQAPRLPAGRRPTTARAAPSPRRRKTAAPAARRAAIPTWERAPLELAVVARRNAAPAVRPVREAAAAPPALRAAARPRWARAEPESRPSLQLPAAAPGAQVVAPMRVKAGAVPTFARQAAWVPAAPASLPARQGRQAPARPRSPRRARSPLAPGPRVEGARLAAARRESPRWRDRRRVRRRADPSSAKRLALERWSQRRGSVRVPRRGGPRWSRCRREVATERRPRGTTTPMDELQAPPFSAWSGGGV